MRESQFYSWLIWRRRSYIGEGIIWWWVRKRGGSSASRSWVRWWCGLGRVVILLPAVHEWGDDIHRDREHDGAVLLRRDVVQGLQVPQLKQSKKTGLTGQTHERIFVLLKVAYYKSKLLAQPLLSRYSTLTHFYNFFCHSHFSALFPFLYTLPDPRNEQI